MKRGKELKYWSILVTAVMAGILTLSIANNGNFKLFAEDGYGAGGYTCYIPEGETEIRDLVIDNELNNGTIYKTRGTVTRVQESEDGQSRAFIQRTNGEDGSKSSIMLNDYNSAYLNVAEGNVIDVEGQYFYAAALPFLRGHNGAGDAYQATVAETTNQNPVEAWEMSVDNFKYYMATGSFTYRDISRLVTLHNVAFSNSLSFGKINYYHESIYLPFAVFDSRYLNEGGGTIETISLVLSTYNTANTNNLSDYLAEHTGDNAIFDLTGVITYLSGSNEYALMLVDVADATVVSENDDSGGDIEEIIRNLEQQLRREMTDQEKEALPPILTLMGELELDEPTYLLSHDDEAIEERLTRDLDEVEITALTHFRNVMNEIRALNILDTIAMLEGELNRLLNNEEKAIVPVIFDLLDNPAIESDEALMQSDAIIASLLGRPLTEQEVNALTLFRAIQMELKAITTIRMLETQLKRPMSVDEKAAVPVIISLMVEFNLDEPDALLADDEVIEELFDHTLSPEESAALAIFRALMEEIDHSGGNVDPPVEPGPEDMFLSLGYIEVPDWPDKEIASFFNKHNVTEGVPVLSVQTPLFYDEYYDNAREVYVFVIAFLDDSPAGVTAAFNVLTEANWDVDSELEDNHFQVSHPSQTFYILGDYYLGDSQVPEATFLFIFIPDTNGSGGNEGTGMSVEETIMMLEEQLGDPLTEEEQEAVLVILELMSNLKIQNPEQLMITDEEILQNYDYTLAPYESEALIVFRDIMTRIAANQQNG